MKPDYGENYEFNWSNLGDISKGRPNLGAEVSVAVYRLGQYTMREAIAKNYGDEIASRLLRESGWIAGREFCLNVLDRSLELNAFVTQLQEKLKVFKVGILRIEKSDPESLSFTLTVS
jgi:uncharacterized protein